MIEGDILLSVVLAVYNGEKYLERVLASCEEISRNELIELVIINDGSTDGSQRIIDRYKLKDSNLRVINKENGGIGSVYNVACDAVKGRYVLILDQDDTLDAKGIVTLTEKLRTCDADAVFYDMRLYRTDGNSRLKTLDELTPHEKGFFADTLQAYAGIFIHNILFKTDILRKNEVYADENYPQMADTMFITRFLSCASSYIYFNIICYNYYFYSGQGISLSNIRVHNDSIQGVLFSLLSYYDRYCDVNNHNYERYLKNKLAQVLQSAYLGALAEKNRKSAIKNLNEKTDIYLKPWENDGKNIETTMLCGIVRKNNGFINWILYILYVGFMKCYDYIYVGIKYRQSEKYA